MPEETMSKHTRGPWDLRLLETAGRDRYPNGYKSIYDLDIRNEVGQRSAGTLIVFGQEGEANARLIAAAPELLMWAKDVIERLGCASVAFGTDTEDSLRMLEKAIAKAEGK
jgi:hypothetical protein